jgi:hypothetical protein
MSFFTKKKIGIWTISLMIGLNLNTVTLAQKQPKQNNSRFRVVFSPPQDARPKSTAGGASRGEEKCSQDANVPLPYLTALVPPNQVGFTKESHPTIFVHIPLTTTSKAFFSIKDEQENHIYQAYLLLDQKGGIVGLKLPKEASPLEIGKQYLWSFVLMCDNKLRPDSPMVQGEIKRIASNQKNNPHPDSVDIFKKVVNNAQSGIWYDTLTHLAQLKTSSQDNQNPQEIWSDFLKSVGLHAVAYQSLLPTQEIN